MADRQIPPALLELLAEAPWPMWNEALTTTALSHDPGCTCSLCTYLRGRDD